MPFTVIQSGTALQFLDTQGGITDISLSNGAVLSQDIPPRWVVYGDLVVLVNTPNFPLTVDALGTVRPLTPATPSSAPVVSAGSSGGLTGDYAGIRYSYIITDADGNLIAESDLSPPSNSVTLTAQNLEVTAIGTSADPISARRLYRPTSDGTTLFPWLDIEGNTITTTQDDLSDVGLSLIAAPTLGNPGRLILCKEWRNRLWGVDDADLDNLRFAQADAMWAWPLENGIAIPGIGRDQFGIKALMPRRDALGVGRRDLIWQVTGETPDDFAAVKLSELVGVESQESVAVFRDTFWWVWKDGVYQWDDNGLTNITDGKVKSWFSTNSYFNRDMFIYSFGVFDPVRLKYRLYLASAGSNVIDSWVEYDITDQTWWGPHKTGAFTPSTAFLLTDATDKEEAIAGSVSGYIWKDQLTATDDLNTGIDFLVKTKFFDGGMPDYEKYWGMISLSGKAQPTGTMTVTPSTGYLNAPLGVPQVYDMTKGRQRLGRAGAGKLMQLTMEHSAPNEPVELYGFEVPYSVTGHR